MYKVLILKILFSIFLIFSTIYNVFAASKFILSQHEFGLSYPLYYEYDEPKLMYLRAGIGEEDPLNNLGILYNYKNSFLLNDYLESY